MTTAVKHANWKVAFMRATARAWFALVVILAAAISYDRTQRICAGGGGAARRVAVRGRASVD